MLSAAARNGAVPYVTGGIGGLTMFQNTALAITNNETFFTGNLGGGVKWYANSRIPRRLPLHDGSFDGHRARLLRPGEPFGHRVYGGLVVNVTP